MSGTVDDLAHRGANETKSRAACGKAGEITLNVADIQRFCMHDGPGVRTTVFLAGCALDCAWCHNPEMRSSVPTLLFYAKKCVLCGACVAVCPVSAHTIAECGDTAHGPDSGAAPTRTADRGGALEHTIDRSACVGCGACVRACAAKALAFSSREMTVGEIMATVERDRAFYGERGGITLSGGEPLCQPSGALALLRACRDAGITTAVETSGYFDPAILADLVPLVDTFLWDIKDTNDERHRRYTGVPNGRIIDNLRRADALGAKIRLRCILVAGVNDDDDRLDGTARLRDSLAGCVGVDVLPYHTFGEAKARFAGVERPLREEWIPSSEAVRRAREKLNK